MGTTHVVWLSIGLSASLQSNPASVCSTLGRAQTDPEVVHMAKQFASQYHSQSDRRVRSKGCSFSPALPRCWHCPAALHHRFGSDDADGRLSAEQSAAATSCSKRPWQQNCFMSCAMLLGRLCACAVMICAGLRGTPGAPKMTAGPIMEVEMGQMDLRSLARA